MEPRDTWSKAQTASTERTVAYLQHLRRQHARLRPSLRPAWGPCHSMPTHARRAKNGQKRGACLGPPGTQSHRARRAGRSAAVAHAHDCSGLRNGPQRLVVLGSEVGGRWGTGALALVRDLVRLRRLCAAVGRRARHRPIGGMQVGRGRRRRAQRQTLQPSSSCWTSLTLRGPACCCSERERSWSAASSRLKTVPSGRRKKVRQKNKSLQHICVTLNDAARSTVYLSPSGNQRFCPSTLKHTSRNRTVPPSAFGNPWLFWGACLIASGTATYSYCGTHPQQAGLGNR